MIINQRCASIREQAKSLTSTTLKPLFNDVVQELKVESNDDLLQEIVQCFDEVPGSTLTDISIINHELFIIIQDKLISIIKKWHSEHETLNKEEETIYLKTSQLLSKMVASTNAINIPVFKTWLLKLPYLEIIKICIQSVGTNGKHLNDPNLQSFGILLKALSDFQRPRPEIMDDTNLLLLLDPVRTCICSKYYLDSFLNLQLDSSTLSVKDDFLLVQCPFYFAGYKGKRREETSNALLDVMLSNYEQIFSKFIPMIHSWNHSIILPIHHITNVLTGTCNVKSCKMRLTKRLNIVNDILIILSADNICNEVKNTLSNAQSMLINSAIACLFNLTLEEDILAYIKEKNVTQAFLKLTNSQYDRIEVHAYMILACIMNEDDIKKLADPTKITAVFINFLKEAVDHPSQRCRGVSVAGLLTGLKGNMQ
ncbi:unnamed protein product [Didymodactylos carnosus]|uniref:Uncharacterized protein n=1 Tax=Didymodactylos carnosus TaxID=1234261 RepID=A0A8S2CWR7_9BILA|nr:unnamed protein product [Didymodactylos carnosus]CAF3535020.1 unnamed protein product [Didymodactylos carnosus]